MFNFPLAPQSASALAPYHDAIFYAITALTVIFTLLVGILVAYFAVRYRAGNKVDRSRPQHENMPLELTWSVIPLLLGLLIFFVSAKLFIEERTPPKDATEIYVIGKQWMWHFQHQNGVRENNTLHVPVGKPIKLTMISQDVLHALYIPEFRLQYHVVPGRYTQAWFTATKPGTYHLFCGMYCGTQHSEMGGTIVVMDQPKFAQWIQNGGNDVPPMSMEQSGALVYHRLACDNCHTGNDTERAPSLTGIYGKPRKMASGGSRIADTPYLREKILTPYADLTSGYIKTMPQYKGQITEDDLLAVIAYIKSLSNTPTSAGTEPRRGETPANSAIQLEPVRAAGALANQEVPRLDKPKQGNLAVGAVAAEQKGTNP